MKKLYIYSTILAICVAISGCTGDYEEMNTNPNAFVTLSSTDLAGLFKREASYAFCGGNDFQVGTNLYANQYAQYFACTTTSFSTDRYVFQASWASTFFNSIYLYTGNPARNIIDYAGEDSPEAAMAYIVWVFAFMELTDYFGPVPYLGSCEGEDVAYNTEEEIYDDFFTLLTNAVTVLKSASASTYLSSGDLVYDGSVSKWIKFANTLRLRLALRLSNVDISRAKTEAEAAYASGVFTSNDDNAAWACITTLTGVLYNRLSRCAYWNEFSMTSTIYSYMKGWNDPRLGIYFQPCAYTNDYHGVPNGLATTEITNENATTAAYSNNCGTKWVTYDGTTTSPVYDATFEIMCYAESLFLRAEGALNGWSMGGTAQDLYEEGIRASMEQWGVTDEDAIDDYINCTDDPAEPDDYLGNKAVCTGLPVLWASTEDVQRQQIGTQKWLALYPEGHEAWAEYRRSGYPIMYNVAHSDNDDLPEGTFIQRLQYPTTQYDTDPDNIAGGVELLGGEDTMAVPLWWSKAANE